MSHIVCGRYENTVPIANDVLLLCVPGLPRRRFLIIQTHVTHDALNFCEIVVLVNSKKLFISICSVITQQPKASRGYVFAQIGCRKADN